MKAETGTAVYQLTEEAIDKIAGQIETFLYSVGVERSNIFRIRLSMEEALLRWMDHFGTGEEVRFTTSIRWRRPEISIAVKGDHYNPLIQAENELGIWSNSLLSSVGITPRYSHNGQYNILQIRLGMIRINPALVLIFSCFAGIAGGTLLERILPDDALEVLLVFLNPVMNMFFRMLNAAAGPIIFLTVAAAICNVGNVMSMRRTGMNLLRRFIFKSTLVTVLGLFLVLPFFHTESFHLSGKLKTVSEFIDIFLGMVPNDFITPFIKGDSPAIIFMAIVIGNLLLVAGNGADHLVRLIDQADVCGLVLADWLSVFSPWIIAILLIAQITHNSTGEILAVWKPLVVFCVLCAIMLSAKLVLVAGAAGVSPIHLGRKLKESFRIAFLSGSVNESYGVSQSCCQNQLGIPRKLIDFGLPMGLVTYMPSGTLAVLVYTLHAASYYHLNVPLEWYMKAVVLAVMLQAANPPMPGVGLLAYTAIFNTLGIPESALTGAVVADTLFRFVIAAVDQAMLQLELVLEAKRLDKLNLNLLKK